MKVATVLGTRPELVKMASVLESLERLGGESMLIHSGQHYDENLSGNFFRDLEIPEPDHMLGVGSGTMTWQTAECMQRLENVLEKSRPDIVLVQGDTNTVLAGALTAAKMGICVGHVEAGLRSGDRRMPEEYNRRVADHISHLLFAPTDETSRILESEKVWGKVFVTGNTVIDACEKFLPLALKRTQVLSKVAFDDFILVTAHRAENVDNPKILVELVKTLEKAPLPVVYPLHPRTRARLMEHGLFDRLAKSKNVQLIDPAGYLDFLALMKKCHFILTDSGGIQEEVTAPSIRKRVLVFRENTERPEAVKAGYATVVGTESGSVLEAMRLEMENPGKMGKGSPFGDGKAGERIAKIVLEEGGVTQ